MHRAGAQNSDNSANTPTASWGDSIKNFFGSFENPFSTEPIAPNAPSHLHNLLSALSSVGGSSSFGEGFARLGQRYNALNEAAQRQVQADERQLMRDNMEKERYERQMRLQDQRFGLAKRAADLAYQNALQDKAFKEAQQKQQDDFEKMIRESGYYSGSQNTSQPLQPVTPLQETSNTPRTPINDTAKRVMLNLAMSKMPELANAQNQSPIPPVLNFYNAQNQEDSVPKSILGGALQERKEAPYNPVLTPSKPLLETPYNPTPISSRPLPENPIPPVLDTPTPDSGISLAGRVGGFGRPYLTSAGGSAIPEQARGVSLPATPTDSDNLTPPQVQLPSSAPSSQPSIEQKAAEYLERVGAPQNDTNDSYEMEYNKYLDDYTSRQTEEAKAVEAAKNWYADVVGQAKRLGMPVPPVPDILKNAADKQDKYGRVIDFSTMWNTAPKKGADGKYNKAQVNAWLDAHNPLGDFVRAVAEYRISPDKVTSMRGQDRTMLAGLANVVNPKYSNSDYARKFKTVSSFSPGGSSANSVSSWATAIDHLDSLERLARDLPTNSSPTSNLFSSGYSDRIKSNPAFVKYNAFLSAVAPELERASRGGSGSSVSGAEHFREALKPTIGKSALLSAIDEERKVLAARAIQLVNLYGNITGTGIPGDILSGSAVNQLRRLYPRNKYLKMIDVPEEEPYNENDVLMDDLAKYGG